MTEKQFKKIIKLRDLFFKHFHSIRLYDYQKEVSDLIIKSVFSKSSDPIYCCMARQSGKTEAVTRTVEFLVLTYPDIARELKIPTLEVGKYDLKVGFFSPQREQIKTDFDRLKANFEDLKRKGIDNATINYNECNATTIKLGNGSICYAFPLTPTSHIESKTLDLALFEEAHDIADQLKKDKADPMMTATKGLEVNIGVGNYQINYFYRGKQKGKNCVIKPYDKVIEDRQKQYENDGLLWHLNYKDFVTQKIANWGEDDNSFKTQYALIDVIGAGQAITMDDFNMYPMNLRSKREVARWSELHGDDFPDQEDIIYNLLKAYDDKGNEEGQIYIAGIDWAKTIDSTVVTVMKINLNAPRKGLIGVAMDVTGIGAVMLDYFKHRTPFRIYEVKFNASQKNDLYVNFKLGLKNREVLISQDMLETTEGKKFKQQMLDLQIEPKGNFIAYHHPEGTEAGEVYHDDYADSFFLCEWAWSQVRKEVEVRQLQQHETQQRRRRNLPTKTKVNPYF